jgi:hypothetical protein
MMKCGFEYDHAKMNERANIHIDFLRIDESVSSPQTKRSTAIERTCGRIISRRKVNVGVNSGITMDAISIVGGDTPSFLAA